MGSFIVIQPQVDFAVNPGLLAARHLASDHQPMVNIVWREIDAALKRKGKTQEWLASELELSNNAISKWKKNGQISRRNAERTSDLLGIPLDRLLLGKEHAIVSIIDALPEENQLQILDFAEFQVRKTENIFGSEKANSYVRMIERLKADMGRRKKGD